MATTRRTRPALLPGALALTLTLALTLALAPGTARAISHAPLDRLLRKHVRGGKVDYQGIKDRSRAELEAYVSAVGRARPAGMGRQARLAFYLNAYNALVLKGVVDRLPGITSVMKVRGFFDRIKHEVGGRKVTLNDLENKIIRPTFKEPRIHFALVCGARSCPPLRAGAFHAKGLERVLERLTRDFINSPSGVRVEGGKVQVSQLFKWYARDFEAAAGSVGKYLARYHGKHAGLLARQTKLKHLHYSWALNKR
jgi:hypothetical protein